MSRPVARTDAGPEVSGPPAVDLLDGRRTEVGGLPVTRSLPQRRRRTIGAWCFVDHFGPADLVEASMRVGPHPHIGLHTVTWVFEGEVLHRDSLGSEQLIRPGQLNLMTAGRGVAHAEETPGAARGALHGLQLWVAQPDTTRSGPAAFEHHAALPAVEAGATVATVLVGELAGARSPARADTPLLGAELVVNGPTGIPLDPTFEHGLLVVEGPLTVDGQVVEPGTLAYLGPGRDEIGLGPSAGRALLLGGTPLAEPILMWWNFVARSREEMDEGRRAWETGSDRFGSVDSGLGRIPAPLPRWGISSPAK
jgi:redox-sensitive bicupin YhaK (pirin superfamily)